MLDTLWRRRADRGRRRLRQRPTSRARTAAAIDDDVAGSGGNALVDAGQEVSRGRNGDGDTDADLAIDLGRDLIGLNDGLDLPSPAFRLQRCVRG